MIAELVTFTHPAGSTRAEIIEGALSVVPQWQANTDLVRKHFLVSDNNRDGAGFYLWPTREAAQKAHNAEWIAAKEKATGAPVKITYYDLLLVVDNATGTVSQP
ncbi:hypothetical protein [Ottowia thiooxydans]|uniref:hypothetical protein n=1 Tax=Ottowia thiooxydans TaxID=219182 RepID=UPI0004218616|nr:hypothetical protein [Ottowia thiooxydans]